MPLTLIVSNSNFVPAENARNPQTEHVRTDIYAAAKILELADRQVFAMGHVVSGHTLSTHSARRCFGACVSSSGADPARTSRRLSARV